MSIRKGKAFMSTDIILVIAGIVSIIVPIATAVWYTLTHPIKWRLLGKTTLITAGIVILLLGTTFLAGYILTPSARGQSTTTPTPPVPAENAEGVATLLQQFCTAISEGNYAAAYDEMTDDLKAYWSPKQELERFVACTPPQASQVTLQGSLAFVTIAMYDAAGNGPHRQLTLLYTGKNGWKISDYR
jgi:hypothetical protein